MQENLLTKNEYNQILQLHNEILLLLNNRNLSTDYLSETIITDYLSLVAVQKIMFTINHFEQINFEIILHCFRYGLLQPNFRNKVTLNSILNMIKKLS